MMNALKGLGKYFTGAIVAAAIILPGIAAATFIVPQGGTGQISLTSGALLVGNGTGNVTTIAPGTSGQVLRSNGTAWVAGADSGVSGASPDYIISTSGGTVTGYKTSTAANVSTSASASTVLAAVISDASTLGASIYFKPGTYYFNATSTFNGTTDQNGTTWTIQGAGQGTTNLVSTNNADLFYFRGTVKTNIGGFTSYLSGGSNGIVASSTSGFRSIWNSNIHDITFTGTTTLSTGYAINMVDDDHNVISNLYIQNIGNCIRTATDGEGKFNPGDENWSNIHCTFNPANNSGGATPGTNTFTTGVGFYFDASQSTTIVNQYTLANILAFDGSGTRTAFRFNHADNIRGVSVEAEGFATTSEKYNGTKMVYMDWEYVTGSSVGTKAYFFNDSTSYDNQDGCTYLDSYAGAAPLFLDYNTDATNPNMLRGVGGGNCALHGSGTFSYATTSASIIKDVQGIYGGSTFNQVKNLGQALALDFASGANMLIQKSGTGLLLSNTTGAAGLVVTNLGTVCIKCTSTTATGLEVNGNTNLNFNVFVGGGATGQGFWIDANGTFLHGVHRTGVGGDNSWLGFRVGNTDIFTIGTTTADNLQGAATTTGQFNIMGYYNALPDIFTAATTTGNATTTAVKIDHNGNLSTLAGASLSVSGAGTFSSTLAVTGNATLSGTGNSLGTITSGTWNGTQIGAVYGGTGQTAVATGDVLYGSATNVWSRLSAGTGGNILAMVNGIPGWVGTTTAGTGLTYNAGSPGNFSVNTSQNIATLSNLTTNGYVKTSGGVGTLGVQAVPIPIADGGTATTTMYAGGILYYDGTLGTVSQSGTQGKLYWDRTNSRLGIGTTSPQVPLHLWQSDSNTVVTTGSAPAFRITNSNTTDNSMGEISFSSVDSTGGTELRTSSILGITTSHTLNSMSGAIAFATRSAGTFAERMRLTAGGALGIGTTSPSGSFQVEAGSATVYTPTAFQSARTILSNSNTTANDFADMDIDGYSTNGTLSTGIRLVGVFTARTSTTLTTDLAIVNGSVETLRVASTGNVGIGTTTPWGKFNVAALSGNTAPLMVISTSTASATSTALILDSNGQVGIGTTTPWRTLSVQGTVALNGLSVFATGDSAVCQRAGGELTVDSGVTSCTVSSQFVKHNIVNDTGALSRIMALNPVSFVYNDTNKPDIGLIAEKVAAVDPRYAQYTTAAKTVDGHTFKVGDATAINWSAITGDLVKVVQDMQMKAQFAGANDSGFTTRLDAQQSEITRLQLHVRLIEEAFAAFAALVLLGFIGMFVLVVRRRN